MKMGKILVPICVLLLIEVVLVYGGSGSVHQVNIWPMPKYSIYGNSMLYLSNDFELRTQGSKYSDKEGILKDGFLRFMGIVTLDHVIDVNFSRFDQSSFLKGINVVIRSLSDEV